MFNLIEEGLQQQQQALDYGNNVIPFPTPELAKWLHERNKVLVHKPEALRNFVERTDDDFGPMDAA